MKVDQVTINRTYRQQTMDYSYTVSISIIREGENVEVLKRVVQDDNYNWNFSDYPNITIRFIGDIGGATISDFMGRFERRIKDLTEFVNKLEKREALLDDVALIIG